MMHCFRCCDQEMELILRMNHSPFSLYNILEFLNLWVLKTYRNKKMVWKIVAFASKFCGKKLAENFSFFFFFVHFFSSNQTLREKSLWVLQKFNSRIRSDGFSLTTEPIKYVGELEKKKVRANWMIGPKVASLLLTQSLSFAFWIIKIFLTRPSSIALCDSRFKSSIFLSMLASLILSLVLFTLDNIHVHVKHRLDKGYTKHQSNREENILATTKTITTCVNIKFHVLANLRHFSFLMFDF